MLAEKSFIERMLFFEIPQERSMGRLMAGYEK